MVEQSTQTADRGAHGFTAPFADDALTVLGDLGVLRVCGADAADFLHRQFTSDVRLVSPVRHQLSAWCNPQGRVLACFRICLREDGFYLLVRRDLLADLEKRLRLFVLRSAVSIENLGAARACLGLAGSGAASLLNRHGCKTPAAPEEAAQNGPISVLQLPGPVTRFLLLGPPAELDALDAALATEARRADSAYWELLDIEAGLPVIGPATAGEFVPQMLNLQALGALSFRKGCYPGQEIVARLQYRGRLKRRLYRCLTPGPDLPVPGSAVHAPAQRAGTVLAAQTHPEGGVALLAVIQIEAAEGDTLRLGDPDGPPLEILDLPYALDAP